MDSSAAGGAAAKTAKVCRLFVRCGLPEALRDGHAPNSIISSHANTAVAQLRQNRVRKGADVSAQVGGESVLGGARPWWDMRLRRGDSPPNENQVGGESRAKLKAASAAL